MISHTHIVTGDALFRHTVNQKVKVNQSSKISSALGVKKAAPQVESRPPPPLLSSLIGIRMKSDVVVIHVNSNKKNKPRDDVTGKKKVTFAPDWKKRRVFCRLHQNPHGRWDFQRGR